MSCMMFLSMFMFYPHRWWNRGGFKTVGTINTSFNSPTLMNLWYTYHDDPHFESLLSLNIICPYFWIVIPLRRNLPPFLPSDFSKSNYSIYHGKLRMILLVMWIAKLFYPKYTRHNIDGVVSETFSWKTWQRT